MDERPIGIFDSGVGGLTVAGAVMDLLPEESIIYFGDTARYPYGNKPPEQVRQTATEVAQFLIAEFDVKLLVVACNTASAVYLPFAMELTTADGSPVPMIGVIEPGVQALINVARRPQVGIIATTGTVTSGTYQKTMRSMAPQMELTCSACPGFVEFVERGELYSEDTRVLTQRLLAPVKEANVDALLLGCTHYPFLSRVIGEVMTPDVALVSSADETAFAVQKVLAERRLIRSTGAGIAVPSPARRWLVSGEAHWFKELGRELLGLPIGEVEVWQDIATDPSKKL